MGFVALNADPDDRLDLLLGAWPGPRTLACLPGRVRANHFDVRALPVDGDGRVVVDDGRGHTQV